MLTDVLRRSHYEAVNELNKMDIYIVELARIKAEHEQAPTPQTLWGINWYEQKKTTAISKYCEIMESIVEPIMLGK